MSQWFAFPAHVPEPGSTVWVRIRSWFGPPFLARWDPHTQSFRSSDNGLDFPWYVAHRWKPQS